MSGWNAVTIEPRADFDVETLRRYASEKLKDHVHVIPEYKSRIAVVIGGYNQFHLGLQTASRFLKDVDRVSVIDANDTGDTASGNLYRRVVLPDGEHALEQITRYEGEQPYRGNDLIEAWEEEFGFSPLCSPSMTFSQEKYDEYFNDKYKVT